MSPGRITVQGMMPEIFFPGPASLRRIAAEAETRGRHAFGLAWLSRHGTIHTFNRPGPATANLGDLDTCRGARIVVGHCRWATHGDPNDNGNNHLHRAGRGWYVHNSVILNHRSLLRRFRCVRISLLGLAS